MSIEAHRYDYVLPPLTLDEGYWSALLDEGENTTTVPHQEVFQVTFPKYDDEMADSIDAGHHYTMYHGESEEDWQAIRDIFESDDVVEVKVVGYNRGGLLIEWRT